MKFFLENSHPCVFSSIDKNQLNFLCEDIFQRMQEESTLGKDNTYNLRNYQNLISLLFSGGARKDILLKVLDEWVSEFILVVTEENDKQNFNNSVLIVLFCDISIVAKVLMKLFRINEKI